MILKMIWKKLLNILLINKDTNRAVFSIKCRSQNNSNVIHNAVMNYVLYLLPQSTKFCLHITKLPHKKVSNLILHIFLKTIYYVMLCCVLSCRVVFRCVVLYYNILCYVMLCCVMLCYVVLYCVMLCYVVLY